MSKNNRYSHNYLLKEKEAMKWLKKQGLSNQQIRDMRWGMVDEDERCINFPCSITSYSYDPSTGEIKREEKDKIVKISVKGSGYEWFFLKSKYKCPWMFTKKIPRSWRKERSREACYSEDYIGVITRFTSSPVSPLLFDDIELLTKVLVSGNMDISIENITKTETKEQTKVTTKV